MTEHNESLIILNPESLGFKCMEQNDDSKAAVQTDKALWFSLYPNTQISQLLPMHHYGECFQTYTPVIIGEILCI